MFGRTLNMPLQKSSEKLLPWKFWKIPTRPSGEVLLSDTFCWLNKMNTTLQKSTPLQVFSLNIIYICNISTYTCFVLPRTHQCGSGYIYMAHQDSSVWLGYIYIYIYIYIYTHYIYVHYIYTILFSCSWLIFKGLFQKTSTQWRLRTWNFQDYWKNRM